jgi:hypothetical protein
MTPVLYVLIGILIGGIGGAIITFVITRKATHDAEHTGNNCLQALCESNRKYSAVGGIQTGRKEEMIDGTLKVMKRIWGEWKS